MRTLSNKKSQELPASGLDSPREHSERRICAALLTVIVFMVLTITWQASLTPAAAAVRMAHPFHPFRYISDKGIRLPKNLRWPPLRGGGPTAHL